MNHNRIAGLQTESFINCLVEQSDRPMRVLYGKAPGIFKEEMQFVPLSPSVVFLGFERAIKAVLDQRLHSDGALGVVDARTGEVKGSRFGDKGAIVGYDLASASSNQVELKGGMSMASDRPMPGLLHDSQPLHLDDDIRKFNAERQFGKPP